MTIERPGSGPGDPTELPSEADDGQLLASALSGEQAAWDALVNRYNNFLWRIARGGGLAPATAEDAVQLTWLRLVEHAHSIRNPQGLAAWLVTTLRRESLRSYRRSATFSPIDELADKADAADGPEALLLRHERDAALWFAVEQLHEPCRSLLVMRCSDPPVSYKHISGSLGLAVGSIGSTQSRCLDSLRTLLHNLGLNIF